MSATGEASVARLARRCAVEGCEKPVKARGWCPMHYCRWLRNGDPLVLTKKPAEHGSIGMYTNNGCRCEPCKAAQAKYMREYTWRTGRSRPLDVWLAELSARPPAPHGTTTRYSNGCRCAACKSASSAGKREWRRKQSLNSRAEHAVSLGASSAGSAEGER